MEEGAEEEAEEGQEGGPPDEYEWQREERMRKCPGPRNSNHSDRALTQTPLRVSKEASAAASAYGVAVGTSLTADYPTENALQLSRLRR